MVVQQFDHDHIFALQAKFARQFAANLTATNDDDLLADFLLLEQNRHRGADMRLIRTWYRDHNRLCTCGDDNKIGMEPLNVLQE